MTLIRFSPAPYHALVAMLNDDPSVAYERKLLGSAGVAKAALLPDAYSFGFAQDGFCLACAGFVPVGETLDGAPVYEAWFTCRPTLARHMLAFVRLAQLTLRELPHDAIVEAYVAPGWRPGERLAHLLGFKSAGGSAPDLWEKRA
jgi:hypothetical protein